MLKYNDVKTKRGVELAEHLQGHYQAQESYFKDGSTILNALKQWEAKFQGQISEVRILLYSVDRLIHSPVPYKAKGKAG